MLMKTKSIRKKSKKKNVRAYGPGEATSKIWKKSVR